MLGSGTVCTDKCQPNFGGQNFSRLAGHGGGNNLEILNQQIFGIVRTTIGLGGGDVIPRGGLPWWGRVNILLDDPGSGLTNRNSLAVSRPSQVNGPTGTIKDPTRGKF